MTGEKWTQTKKPIWQQRSAVHINRVLEGGEKECVSEKNISRNNGRKCLKFCKTHKPTDSGSSINPIQHKYKETHIQGHHNETT